MERTRSDLRAARLLLIDDRTLDLARFANSIHAATRGYHDRTLIERISVLTIPDGERSSTPTCCAFP